MKKIKLTINIENYYNKVPQAVKHNLYDMFGGFENMFEEAITTISNSMVRDLFNLTQTKSVLSNHCYETISAVLEEDDVSDEFLSHAATGFYEMCFDLHDAVIPHIREPGLELSEVHVSVDEVDTFGQLHGDVLDEVDAYITCQSIHEEDTHRADTSFEMDDEQLYDWTPNKLHPFVRGVMVDVILQFLRYGMQHPANMKSPSNVCVYHIVWKSIRQQIEILSQEMDGMDDHNYNPDVLDMWHCYEVYLKHDDGTMNELVDNIAGYVTDFFYSPSKLKDEVWSNLTNFKNAMVFRDKNNITFKLLAH